MITSEDRAILRQAKDVRARRNKEIRSSRPKLVRVEGQRQPRVREPAYLQWIRRLPCVACMVLGEAPVGAIEAAHIRYSDYSAGWRNPGGGAKPDDRKTAPLCRGHHRDGPNAQHSTNERKWWENLRINPPELCSALTKAYDHGRSGALVIQMFASVARL